jgi:hypothetical protein
MADDDAPGGGGSLFQGKPVAGVPRPLAVGGLIILGTAALVWWWHRKSKGAASSSTSTVITGSSSTGVDAATLDAILRNWQQHPATTSGSTAASGTGTGGGSGPGGGQGSSSATGTGGTTFSPTGPGTSTDESGNMHGVSLAQAMYLFDTGNMPYVFNPSTGEFTRWSGTPVAGQTYYAGPYNWGTTLKNGTIVGGTKGHPTYSAGNAPKTTPAKKPAPKKAPAKKPAPARK